MKPYEEQKERVYSNAEHRRDTRTGNHVLSCSCWAGHVQHATQLQGSAYTPSRRWNLLLCFYGLNFCWSRPQHCTAQRFLRSETPESALGDYYSDSSGVFNVSPVKISTSNHSPRAYLESENTVILKQIKGKGIQTPLINAK